MKYYAEASDISTGHVEYLDDLYYADDLSVLACTQAQIRDKTKNVWLAEMLIGLDINELKTKVKN